MKLGFVIVLLALSAPSFASVTNCLLNSKPGHAVIKRTEHGTLEFHMNPGKNTATFRTVAEVNPDGTFKEFDRREHGEIHTQKKIGNVVKGFSYARGETILITLKLYPRSNEVKSIVVKQKMYPHDERCNF